jgi:integrase/recombinase XerD
MSGRVYKREGTEFLWLDYTLPSGKRVRQSSGTSDEREAEKKLKQLINASKSLSFKEAVIDFFATRRDLKPSSVRRYEVSLVAVDPFIGHLALSDIDVDVIKGFISVRRKAVQDASVRRDLAFISTVFSHAIENIPKGPQFNPVIMLPKRSLKENERTRWLRWEEYERLLASCTQDQHRLIIKTAVLTGMRHGELAALRKGMFLWDRNEVVLPVAVTKTSTERVVPLCAELVTELQAHCAKAPKDYVFYHDHPPEPYKAFTRFWHGARRRAKLKDVRFHDLRHTFGSWWVQSGGDIYPLSKVMGHTTTQMTQRYAHLNTEAAHREAQEVFRHIFRHSSEDSEAQEPLTD